MASVANLASTPRPPPTTTTTHPPTHWYTWYTHGTAGEPAQSVVVGIRAVPSRILASSRASSPPPPPPSLKPLPFPIPPGPTTVACPCSQKGDRGAVPPAWRPPPAALANPRPFTPKLPTPLCRSDGGGTAGERYRLRGVVVHAGGSVHSGHYYAFVCAGGGDGGREQWVCANDSSVEPSSWGEVRAGCALSISVPLRSLHLGPPRALRFQPWSPSAGARCAHDTQSLNVPHWLKPIVAVSSIVHRLLSPMPLPPLPWAVGPLQLG